MADKKGLKVKTVKRKPGVKTKNNIQDKRNSKEYEVNIIIICMIYSGVTIMIDACPKFVTIMRVKFKSIY